MVVQPFGSMKTIGVQIVDQQIVGRKINNGKMKIGSNVVTINLKVISALQTLLKVNGSG